MFNENETRQIKLDEKVVDFKKSLINDQIKNLKANYERGGFGYGHAKQEFFELILEKFSKERSEFDHYLNNLDLLDDILKKGANKAGKTAEMVLARVRKKLGYN